MCTVPGTMCTVPRDASAVAAALTAARDRRTWRFAAALLLGGVAAGLVAAGLTALLHAVQHLAFGYRTGHFEDGVLHAARWRRVVVLAVAGVVAGGGWYLLGRFARPTVRVRTAVQQRVPMRPVPTVLESVLQIVVVGLGASLGRESAPRRTSGALAQVLGQRVGLPPEQLRVLVACAAGAGFGAVYDVPAAGALFALEVLLRSVRPAHVLTAAGVAAVATVVAWIEVPTGAFYDVGFAGWSWLLLLAALVAGPLTAAAGLGFEWVTAWAGRHRARGRAVPATAVPVFLALGVLAVWAPSLLGNGRGPAQLAFDDARTDAVLIAFGLAKPLVTAACLRTGATGGLVTPALATGALLGAGLGGLVLTPALATEVAVLGVAGLLTVTMRAPLTAVAFAFEVTGAPWWFLVPVLVTAAGAWTCTAGWRRPPG